MRQLQEKTKLPQGLLPQAGLSEGDEEERRTGMNNEKIFYIIGFVIGFVFCVIVHNKDKEKKQ